MGVAMSVVIIVSVATTMRLVTAMVILRVMAIALVTRTASTIETVHAWSEDLTTFMAMGIIVIRAEVPFSDPRLAIILNLIAGVVLQPILLMSHG